MPIKLSIDEILTSLVFREGGLDFYVDAIISFCGPKVRRKRSLKLFYL